MNGDPGSDRDACLDKNGEIPNVISNAMLIVIDNKLEHSVFDTQHEWNLWVDFFMTNYDRSRCFFSYYIPMRKYFDHWKTASKTPIKFDWIFVQFFGRTYDCNFENFDLIWFDFCLLWFYPKKVIVRIPTFFSWWETDKFVQNWKSKIWQANKMQIKGQPAFSISLQNTSNIKNLCWINKK